jgi:putative inorganic carbon (hco3(-)) transporter
MCLFVMLESKKWWGKLFYSGVLALLIFSIVATQSRGGILALGAVVFYLWMKSDGKMLGVIGIVFIIGFILAVAPPEFFQRMQTMTETGENMEGSAAGRIAAWTAGVKMALDHPLTGVGAGHFPVKYGVEYRPEGTGASEVPWHTAHSNYFVILGELGFPGLTFLLAVLIGNFSAMERVYKEIKAHGRDADRTIRRLILMLNASLVAFIVGGAFLTAIRYPHLYVLAALLECGRFIYAQSPVSQPVEVPEAMPLKFGRAPV